MQNMFNKNERDYFSNPNYMPQSMSPEDANRNVALEFNRKKHPFRNGFLTGIAISLGLVLIFNGIMYALYGVLPGKTFLSKKDADKLNVLNSVLDKYYYKDLSHKQKVEGMYKGLMNGATDPYTEYYTQKEYIELMKELTGTYAGIGAVLSPTPTKDGYEIKEVYKGTPAEQSGLKVGDVIVEVNGKKITSKNIENFIMKNIRGEKGDRRVINVKRGEDTVTIKVTLDEIVTPTVTHKMLDSETGYIRISQFTATTTEDFKSALKDLQAQGMKKIIYDLRDNGGGLVDSVAAILDELLPKGKVVYTKDKYGKEEVYNSDEEKQLNIPAVILVNGNTASASEIFTGAMRDYKRATIIGTKTFGKGIVQQTLPLSDGSAIKITTARYYTPKGECIHGKGIKPDIELEYQYAGTEGQEYDESLDNQIQKGLEVLSNK